MARIAALFLAAGESTRMGQPKALLPWHGKTLLQHQVTALSSAGVSRIVAVLGHQSETLESLIKGQSGVQCIYNPHYQQGKTTSIKAGLSALRQAWDGSIEAGEEEAILVLNVDQPRSSDIIRRTMELHIPSGGNLPGHNYLITIPTYRGKGGHPIILSTSLLAELLEISEETQGLKTVVSVHKGDTQRVEIDAPEILLDLNTPQDYREALKMFTSDR